jgi:hypothetical protein
VILGQRRKLFGNQNGRNRLGSSHGLFCISLKGIEKIVGFLRVEATLLGSAFRFAIIPSFKNKYANGVGTVNCQTGVARRNLVAFSASSMRRTRMSPKRADSLNDGYQARENHFEVVVLEICYFSLTHLLAGSRWNSSAVLQKMLHFAWNGKFKIASAGPLFKPLCYRRATLTGFEPVLPP